MFTFLLWTKLIWTWFWCECLQYVRSLSLDSAKQGWNVVVCNHRGMCGISFTVSGAHSFNKYQLVLNSRYKDSLWFTWKHREFKATKLRGRDLVSQSSNTEIRLRKIIQLYWKSLLHNTHYNWITSYNDYINMSKILFMISVACLWHDNCL